MAPRTQYGYDYDPETGSYTHKKIIYPSYNSYKSVMYILYGASKKFEAKYENWFFPESESEQGTREEPFSALWDQNPEAVLRVLAYTKSDQAVDFALRIINEHPSILENATKDMVSALIQHYHPRVLELIIDNVREAYATQQPEDAIVLALLRSKHR